LNVIPCSALATSEHQAVRQPGSVVGTPFWRYDSVAATGARCAIFVVPVLVVLRARRAGVVYAPVVLVANIWMKSMLR
jgi:hypothetical protein